MEFLISSPSTAWVFSFNELKGKRSLSARARWAAVVRREMRQGLGSEARSVCRAPSRMRGAAWQAAFERLYTELRADELAGDFVRSRHTMRTWD